MSEMIAWIAAEADRGDGVPLPEDDLNQSENQNPHFSQKTREMGHPEPGESEIGSLPSHGFPARDIRGAVEENAFSQDQGDAGQAEDDDYETQRARRIYRGRTVAMLRRYMRYSIETGRLPSLLGREFFRTQVTSYTVVTFEDRVIFVHDMERCLEKLDEFSRQIIARHILQEHDRWATARLLGCNEKTIRRLTPIALDLLSEILLDVGLLDRLDMDSKKSCQGGFRSEFPASDCEDGKNKI